MRTRIELNSSEAKTLKSKPRPRFGLVPESFEPAVDRASRPFRRTRVKSLPRPRTTMVRPSPLSRSIDTPGRRWIDSARLASGKSAMSSALIASIISLAVRLVSRALRSAPRMPVTTTSSTSATGSCGAVWAWTVPAVASARARPEAADRA